MASNIDFEKLISGKQALIELIKYNVPKEYNALKKILGKQKTKNKYSLARLKILRYLLDCVKHDPYNGDYYDEVSEEGVKEAGKLLYEFDGMNGMTDRLVWSFIPKRYKRTIDMIWNGIGEWQG